MNDAIRRFRAGLIRQRVQRSVFHQDYVLALLNGQGSMGQAMNLAWTIPWNVEGCLFGTN